MAIQLAPREQQYVNCVKQSMSDKEAARAMNCEIGAILSTAKRARYKLHAKNRTELVINAIRQGFIELSLIICLLSQSTVIPSFDLSDLTKPDPTDTKRQMPRPRSNSTRTARNTRTSTRGSNYLRMRTARNQAPWFDTPTEHIASLGCDIYQTYDLQDLNHEQNTDTPNHA